MAESAPQVAPVLSTPDTHIFEDPTPASNRKELPFLDDEQLHLRYEIERTVDEIRAGRWQRIALQFPDEMLVDAPRIFQAIRRGLRNNKSMQRPRDIRSARRRSDSVNGVIDEVTALNITDQDQGSQEIYILADTSYGACCVDEIAAEHVNADVVVHYGRSCLSPTARLPVIYVFTTRNLPMDPVVEAFETTFKDRNEKIVLMADIPYINHVKPLHEILRKRGYRCIFATYVLHNPSSPLPNRTVPEDVAANVEALRDYQIFHISDPPPSLLLTLSSRVGAFCIYPVDGTAAGPPKPTVVSSAATLRRRYALVTSVTAVSIFGILINTLSVKNYLHIVEHVKRLIAAAGKKSYTFVIGKVNAAKVANFSEVGGWVVIGCWESSLLESRDFWKPIITPFELELALMPDASRVWTGEWTSDFQVLLREASEKIEGDQESEHGRFLEENGDFGGPLDGEEESAPPDFDLRTGRYVSHSRPIRANYGTPAKHATTSSGTGLIKRATGVATIGGEVSLGAEYLKSKRTWQGLGSDFEISYDDNINATNGAPVEEEVPAQAQVVLQAENSEVADLVLSLFERIVSSYPPILESLVQQLPTPSLFDLYHTSRYLRSFLQNYPLAWSHLSFRVPPAPAVLGNPSLGTDTPDGREWQSKLYALDALLLQVVVPCGQRLKTLDLDNSAVSGILLVSRVLEPRRDTLEHLSVRGCKNVSIKYHILPYLQLQANLPPALTGGKKLALTSLYAYRCRHHRRRPYFPSSLVRRDSDSEPTHELVELCHALAIWTDTAWCPTPGPRCFRRKDYHLQRGSRGRAAVWVPFDRLWRSGNRLGPSDDTITRTDRGGLRPGLLWEEIESGHDGEPLGTGNNGQYAGEGKGVPPHIRRSHRMFVDNVRCDSCGDEVPERCEQCSIRMHCMGCRKTLCASCAFNRPMPRKATKRRRPVSGQDSSSNTFGTHDDSGYGSMTNVTHTSDRGSDNEAIKFWWAPGALRCPNIVDEDSTEAVDWSDYENEEQSLEIPTAGGTTQPAPKLNSYWCCIEPVFSAGGGIAFLGPHVGGKGVDRIRTCPLPKEKGFEDPAFSAPLSTSASFREAKAQLLLLRSKAPDILPYLEEKSSELQALTCPRSLCKKCYVSTTWKVPCTACKRPLCREHDFKGLKIRKCGFRNMAVEAQYVRNPPVITETPPELEIPQFRGTATTAARERIGCVDEDTEGAAEAECRKAARQAAVLSPDVSPPVRVSEPTPTPQEFQRQSGTVRSVLDLSLICDNAVPPIAVVPHLTLTISKSPRGINSLQTSSNAQATPRPRRSLSASGICDLITKSLSSSTGARLRPIGDNLREHDRKPAALPCTPGHPVQWTGCGAYFCMQTRPIGDSRPRCESGMRECCICGVWVCETCQSKEPSLSSTCPCSRCNGYNPPFHCPVCDKLPAVRERCRFLFEEIERQEQFEREQEKRERLRVERVHADTVLEMSCGFWNGVENDQCERDASSEIFFAPLDDEEKCDTMANAYSGLAAATSTSWQGGSRASEVLSAEFGDLPDLIDAKSQ